VPGDKSILKHRIQNIITSGMDKRCDIEVKRKTILIYIISTVGLINLIPLAIVALIQGNRTLGIFDLIVALVLLTILFLLRRRGYHIYYSYLGVIFAGALYCYLFASGGVNGTGHLWYYTFPLFTSFLLGSKRGAIAISILFAIACLIFIIEDYIPIVTTYSTDFKIRFILSFLAVFALSYFFENIREKTQQQLAKKNADLKTTITELRQAEEALRESETLLKATLESTADGILVVNDLGQVVATNARFGEMWHLPEQIIETNDDDKLLNCVLDQLKEPEAFLSKVQELYKKSKKDLDILYFKDGSIFERYSEPLIVENSIAGRVWSFRDITERVKAEAEKAKLHVKLQRSQKMEAVGTLAGGVAHDLNNILSGIVSYPDLLLTQLPKDDPLRNPIATIRDSGNKAATIVQDLLTLARRGVAVKEVVNLNKIIAEYLKSPEYEKLISFHPHIKVKTDLADNILHIFGSPVHLTKTVMNLVSNAAEAMPDTGEITISTEIRYIDSPVKGYDNVKEGDYILLKVVDSGIGISSTDIERIFEPFYTKKVMGRSGTGLGMAVVWGTVKDHRGHIDVQSTEGKGTTFTLYFSATREITAGDTADLNINDYKGRGESILVVDDVKEQREIATSILSELGYCATSVSSGEKAVEYLLNNSADLLILDMIMDPGMDGLATYKRILQIHPDQKALIASGFSETVRVRAAQKLGAGVYVKKPYTLESIGITVKMELEKS
jgi:signal transduction histidine kinase